MDITEIWGIVSGVITALGGWGAWAYRRQNRRLKDSEAALAEANVTSAKYDGEAKRIADLHATIDILNRQLHDAHKRCADQEKIIADKTGRIREKDGVIEGLHRKLFDTERYVGTLKQYIGWLKNWHCRREHGDGPDECLRREPRQRIRLEYDPPKGIMDVDDEEVNEGKSAFTINDQRI